MNKDTALRLALEALEHEAQRGNDNAYKSERDAIKAALEAKDEPVAEVTSETGADITMSWWHEPALPMGTKLYTTPPQRTWVGLTDIDYAGLPLEQVGLVRWAEAKLKENNT